MPQKSDFLKKITPQVDDMNIKQLKKQQKDQLAVITKIFNTMNAALNYLIDDKKDSQFASTAFSFLNL